MSAPVRKGDWWYVTRTEEGASYAIHCRGRSAETADGRCPARRERRGRRPRLLRARRVRRQRRPRPARLEQRPRRQRALHVARPRPDHRHRSRRRARRHDVGRCRLVGRQHVPVLRQARRADASVPGVAPPARHRAGRRRARLRGPRRALLRRRRADPQRRVDRHRVREQDQRRGAAGARGRPGRRAGGRAPAGRRRRVLDRSLGRPLRRRHQPRRRGLPRDDRTDRRTRGLDRTGRPRAGPADHHRRAVRRPPRPARVGPMPRRSCGFCSATVPSGPSSCPRSRTTSRSTPTPSGRTTGLRFAYQSFTMPATVYEEDVRTGERMLLKQTPVPERRPQPLHGSAAVGDRRTTARQVPVDVVSRADLAADGSAPVPGLRLRQLRDLDAAVVQPRAVVAARPRRRVGARPSARWRRARPALVPRRQAAAQAQHVHRHDRVHRAPRRLGVGGAGRVALRGRLGRRAARRRVHDDAAGPVRRGRRRGAVRRRRARR